MIYVLRTTYYVPVVLIMLDKACLYYYIVVLDYVGTSYFYYYCRSLKNAKQRKLLLLLLFSKKINNYCSSYNIYVHHLAPETVDGPLHRHHHHSMYPPLRHNVYILFWWPLVCESIKIAECFHGWFSMRYQGHGQLNRTNTQTTNKYETTCACVRACIHAINIEKKTYGVHASRARTYVRTKNFNDTYYTIFRCSIFMLGLILLVLFPRPATHDLFSPIPQMRSVPLLCCRWMASSSNTTSTGE